MKILIAILTMATLITSANADAQAEINEDLKKQCQYLVYGNGENNVFVVMYMYGVTAGMIAMLTEDEVSDYVIKKTPSREIVYKACQSALTNTEKLEFQTIFKLEVGNLIIK